MGSPAGQAHPPAFSLLTFLIVPCSSSPVLDRRIPSPGRGFRPSDCPRRVGPGRLRVVAGGGDVPVRCFRPDPVCGVDGVTYWCGCADAACVGVRVAKLGFCEVGNGGSGLLSGQALLLVHIVWLIVLGFSVLFGLF
ncbi:unnamed protein product [Spirodela intermedia]|uniref:Uncharacterized protein n=1 Tax=Spirodela intermedia TaxID=51605 RepID=A0A7I8JU38_SPIIN|nr:unnamed protein product [Spirodela intermedia]CAA6673698.1 unnamed protein product [Spirodela intermedia]